ncbi:hypothetical protein CW304_19535 [Bacillus sp. UFRGS-B20]|nr:hypothetical protein CW304_19535 [Bacillus sp. UFRGS-B20]
MFLHHINRLTLRIPSYNDSAKENRVTFNKLLLIFFATLKQLLNAHFLLYSQMRFIIPTHLLKLNKLKANHG